MQKIVPNLWFQSNSDEAVEFYRDALPDTRLATSFHYPAAHELPDFQKDFAGELLTAEIEVAGYRICLINAGDEFRPNPAISFMLNFDPARDSQAREHLDETWRHLSDGGTALMPLDEYPFSPHYGWIQDRYGVSWQLMLTDPQGEPRPFVLPALMFCGPAQNRAQEAMDRYVSIFPDAQIGTLVPYPQAQGPVTEGSVMFADFTLCGQWFVAMDSGVEQPFTFDPGVSLAVMCEDQEEIDRYWKALSTVPEAEVCGWCQDAFGVSWQVTPHNSDELLSAPGAYQRMVTMKKFDIAFVRGE